MKPVILYHGSGEIIEFPEIRKTKYTKDFSWGFYCTNSYEHKRDDSLNILRFETLTDDWLDYIAECRDGGIHNYDIVEGPMADDTVWNFVNDYLGGNISKEVFWEYAKFEHPTHQISFHTIRALNCLKFERTEKINGGEKIIFFTCVR